MSPQTQAALAAGTITEVPWVFDVKKENCPGCIVCCNPGTEGHCIDIRGCDLCGSSVNFHQQPGGEPLIYFDPDPHAQVQICHECIDGYLAEAGTAKEAT